MDMDENHHISSPHEMQSDEKHIEYHSLKCTGWGDNLLQCLRQLQAAHSLCDTTIVIPGGRVFTAHSAVLAGSSPVIRQRFSLQTFGKYTLRLDLSPEAVTAILTFVYTGTIKASDSIIPLVWKGARILQILPLMEWCAPKLKSVSWDPDNGRNKTGSKDPSNFPQQRNSISRKITNDVQYPDKEGTMTRARDSLSNNETKTQNVVDEIIDGDYSQPNRDGGSLLLKALLQKENNTEKELKKRRQRGSIDKYQSLRALLTDPPKTSAEIESENVYNISLKALLSYRIPSEHEHVNDVNMNYDSVVKPTAVVTSDNHDNTLADFLYSPGDTVIVKQEQFSDQEKEQESSILLTNEDITSPPAEYNSDMVKQNPKQLLPGGVSRPVINDNGMRMHACVACGKLFKYKSHVKKHYSRVHAKEKTVPCIFCEKYFYDQSDLQTHLKNHTGERPYACKICDKTFIQRTHLIAHERRHTGFLPHKCQHCGKAFPFETLLKKHSKIHTDERPFTCSFCNKKFRSKGNLTCHVRLHTGEKPYKCRYCELAYPTSTQQVLHERIHTNEKPYSCDSCNMKFASGSQLRAHRRRHTGEKPYKCNFCHKCFAQASSYNYHVLSHTGEKPHKCRICGQAFRGARDRKSHETKCHTEDVSLFAEEPDGNDPKPVMLHVAGNPNDLPPDMRANMTTLCTQPKRGRKPHTWNNRLARRTAPIISNTIHILNNETDVNEETVPVWSTPLVITPEEDHYDLDE